MAALANLQGHLLSGRRGQSSPPPPPTSPSSMEATLDWSLPYFSSYYQSSWTVNEEGIPSARRALLEPFPSSPVFSTEFGNVTAKWKIRIQPYLPPPPGSPPPPAPEANNQNNSGKEYWNFHLDLMSKEINPAFDEPPVRRRRNSDAGAGGRAANPVPLKVKCQLFLLRNPRTDPTNNDDGTLDSAPARKINFFGSNCGSVELGWPHYTGQDRREAHNEAHQIQSNLWRWVAPRAPLQAPWAPAVAARRMRSFPHNPLSDILRVRVRLTEVELQNMPPPSSQGLVGLTVNLANDLGRVLDSGEDSDVLIKCGPATFPVHKFVLSIRSPVFKARLQPGTAEAISGEISIQDTEASIMKQLLEFIYTAHVQLIDSDIDQVIALIAVADKYEVTDLKHVCFQRLFANLNEESCGKLAVAAYLHHADQRQRNLIYEYNSEHWRTLGSKPEFQALVEAYPAAFLKK